MAALDWSQCPAVESIPGKVSGAWVFKGTRLPVATIIENLEDLSIDEVVGQFDVSREQVMAGNGELLTACGNMAIAAPPALCPQRLAVTAKSRSPSSRRFVDAVT